jgi:membrane protease YdiL (CAAX protease family)
LFWLLLVSASAALSSGMPMQQQVGLIETCGFLAVAISSAGHLKTLGLEFIAWEKISRNAILSSIVIGFAAGLAILGIARWAGQPIGIEPRWNIAVLAIIIGPILEEIIFRGYLLTLALWLTRRMPRRLSSTGSIFGAAIVFAAIHLGKSGITALQFSCIAFMGWVYGCVRIHSHSTVGAVMTHAMYNCTLYLSFCLSP